MMDCTFSWIRGRRTTSRQGSWTDSVSAEVDTESDPTDQVKKRRHRVSQAQLPLGRAFLTLPTQCHQSLTHANTVCHSHKWTERREMVVGPFGSSDRPRTYPAACESATESGHYCAQVYMSLLIVTIVGVLPHPPIGSASFSHTHR